jgi:hypothetical protein
MWVVIYTRLRDGVSKIYDFLAQIHPIKPIHEVRKGMSCNRGMEKCLKFNCAWVDLGFLVAIFSTQQQNPSSFKMLGKGRNYTTKNR